MPWLARGIRVEVHGEDPDESTSQRAGPGVVAELEVQGRPGPGRWCTICCKIITVLTRYRPIVLELI